MYIHEALAKARPGIDSIYRQAWIRGSVIRQGVQIIPATGQMYHTCPTEAYPFGFPWIPKADDLIADDWQVYRHVKKDRWRL